MNPHLSRALMLLQTSRPEMAEKEARLAILDDSHDPIAYGVLANCLVELNKFQEATDAARQAIEAAPDLAYGHYTLARVMLQRNRPAEAIMPILTALELNPFDADVVCLEGTINFQLERWQDALASADRGLSIDAEHVGCRNLRSTALMKLGRHQEAQAASQGVLADSPENAVTHASAGWNYLHQGDHKKALEHFREALRLDPNYEFARIGMLEAMQAKNPLFRILVRFNLRMSKLTSGGRWGVLIGAWVLNQILRTAAKNYPAISPYVTPLLILYMVFALWTWIGGPVAKLMLRLDRVGRYALSRDQIWSSNIFGLLVLTAALLLGTGFAFQWFACVLAGGLTLCIALFAPQIFDCHVGWPRWGMAAFVAALALDAGVLIGAYLLGHSLEIRGDMEGAHRLFEVFQNAATAFVYLLIGGMFLTNYLTQAVPRR